MENSQLMFTLLSAKTSSAKLRNGLNGKGLADPDLSDNSYNQNNWSLGLIDICQRSDMYLNGASLSRYSIISRISYQWSTCSSGKLGQRYFIPFGMNQGSTVSFVRQHGTSKRDNENSDKLKRPGNGSKIYIWSLIALNASVFLAWNASRSDPQLYIFLRETCLVSVDRIKSHRYYTLLTSTISHQEPVHLLSNMYTLHLFSAILWRCPGLKLGHFVILTLGSGIAGSAAYVIQKLKQGLYQPALGASGMVMGMGAAASLLVPRQPMLFMGIVPMPLGAIVAGYAAFDTYYLTSNSSVAHSGHLGGLIFGSAYYFLSLYRFGGVGRFFQKGLKH